MGFKERMGLKAPRVEVQTDSLDAATRIELWNAVHDAMIAVVSARPIPSDLDRRTLTTHRLWRGFYGQPLDEFPGQGIVLQNVKTDVITAEWFDVLELVEELPRALQQSYKGGAGNKFMSSVNDIFARYLVGYRFVNSEILPVTDEVELTTIETAARAGGLPAEHISRAIRLLSDREGPIYSKVVQESIHAVEAKVTQMTGAKMLPDGLKALEKRGFQTHPALLTGWTKLYGYTSDAAGIRHALVRDEDVDEPLAVYFLVTCSAFVNLLTKLEARQQG